MRAAQISHYGGPDVMRTVANAPKPEAAAGQVLVAVSAAGVNPFDWKVRDGLMQQMAALQFPATLGGDFAGEVVALGKGVTGVHVGDAVYGQANALSGQGSFAEYSVVKASQLAPKPQTLDFIQAASLPLASVSAYQALVDRMNLHAGQKILVHGAGGGIGSLAVQLAKHLDAHVAATASATDADFVKELGAQEVIDYRTQDFAALLKEYDAVFDTVGGDTNTRSYAVLKPGGILVSMAAQPDERLVRQHNITYTHQVTRVTPERLRAITELVNGGALRPLVDKVFPLEKAAEALEYQKTAHPRGKVVIQI
ncbi:MAG TPA: NADP-dependent oxidoreductase [Candidatus Saccharimonadales bacterium]|nr:NADP-dependent oxidoreductase [Candidatus Saccharimonadales bacterium]